MNINKIMHDTAKEYDMWVTSTAVKELESLIKDWIEGIIIPNAVEHAKKKDRKKISVEDIIYAKDIVHW